MFIYLFFFGLNYCFSAMTTLWDLNKPHTLVHSLSLSLSLTPSVCLGQLVSQSVTHSVSLAIIHLDMKPALPLKNRCLQSVLSLEPGVLSLSLTPVSRLQLQFFSSFALMEDLTRCYKQSVKYFTRKPIHLHKTANWSEPCSSQIRKWGMSWKRSTL